MNEHTATPACLAMHNLPGRYQVAQHIVMVDNVLVQASVSPRYVMIWMPPRHGKSELVSAHFPAWYEGTFPDRHVLFGSYAASLAQHFGGRARDILDRHGDDFGGVTVRRDTSAKDNWRTSEGGSMRSVGVGGQWTGFGGNMIIIDDPMKGFEAAHSEVQRRAVHDWWTTDVYTRLEPNASVVIMGTRWHEDDLQGWLLTKGDLPWEVLALPAFAEEDDPMGREVGAALWPERWPAASLRARKKSLGTYRFDALYQQGPEAPDGDLFKRKDFRYWSWVGTEKERVLRLSNGHTHALRSCVVFVTADTAITAKTKSDWSVMCVWARTPDSDLVLLHVYRERLEGPDILGFAMRVYRAWRPVWIGIEEKMSGTDLIQRMKRIEGIPVRALQADTDKYTRAIPMAALYEAEKVWHPVSAPWLGEYEKELIAFPNGRHDDQVDAAAYAARYQRFARARSSRPRGRIPRVQGVGGNT